MSLSNFITERLKITSNSRSLRIKPTTYKELRSLIEQELKGQGPDADLNFIDTSEITDMSSLFKWLGIRNIKIDEWNISNVTNMWGMFSGCENFKGEGLEKWNVSNVTEMRYMFDGCKDFVGDLSDWDTSNVKNMRHMFDECTKFNSDLSAWNVSNVENMRYMFHNCKRFNADLSWWNVSSVTDMEGMFLGCWKFKQDLSGWNVSRVRTYKNFFGKKNIMPENFKPTF